jgi:flagella basal body P-ring formation protein FlgA
VFNKKLFLFFTIFLLKILPSNANEALYGKDIKYQATKFFEQIGLQAEILTSDKRAFFYCSQKLTFHPRIENDWRTVDVKCSNENWQSTLRTTATLLRNPLGEKKRNIKTFQVFILVRNMSKGQVINQKDISLVEKPTQSVFEGFNDLEDLIGRKVTTNLSKGTILKPRHVKFKLNINKNDTVLVILGNGKLSITTYGIALDSGQIGDMVTIENKKSQKKFKAIVLGEKKVRPLTNM